MREESYERRIPIYQVDAFSDGPFGGNPAAVCILQGQYKDTILQAIAAEMNLSETAFLFPIEGKSTQESGLFSLRWFTPKLEVPLCGHATLATAAVLFYDIGVSKSEVAFQTLSGRLTAKRDKNGILLDFPANEPEPIDPPDELLKAVGVTNFQSVVYAKNAKKLLVQLESEESVKNLEPNFEAMKRVNTIEDIIGVIVISPGSPPYDFISRFFAPWVGVDEDPVTGSAHTVLTPYWSKILDKEEMLAYQASTRGGKLIVRICPNDRVNLIGNAVIVLKGELYL